MWNPPIALSPEEQKMAARTQKTRKFQIPPDLVVKSQTTDIIDIILQLIRRPNGVHRACRNRKSRGELLSTSEIQWSTTKYDGVWSSGPDEICASSPDHDRGLTGPVPAQGLRKLV